MLATTKHLAQHSRLFNLLLIFSLGSIMIALVVYIYSPFTKCYETDCSWFNQGVVAACETAANVKYCCLPKFPVCGTASWCIEMRKGPCYWVLIFASVMLVSGALMGGFALFMVFTFKGKGKYANGSLIDQSMIQ